MLRLNLDLPIIRSLIFYNSFIQKSAGVRFFECAANSADGERLRQEGETSLAGRNR